MIMKSKNLLRIVPLVVAVVASSKAGAQQSPQSVKAVQVIGLPAVKDNAKGNLAIENGSLRFVHDKKTSDISTTSIQEVTTGTDSQKAVGKTVGTLSMAAPYGGGRFLSLFRKKIDTLTVAYRDTEGALHGVIFTMPSGEAETVRQRLIAEGAGATVASEHVATTQTSVGSLQKEKN